MDYRFPEIKHLDDVRPAIEGRDEFVIAQRDWGYVVNYMVAMADTFPPVSGEMDAIRRECRGLLFYPDGRIMARRLHKFFNVNERDETQHHLIDLGKPHVILEKLDGSMITPVVLGWVPEETMPNFGGDPSEQIMRVGDMRWGTKMGVTEVSMQAEEFVARNPGYERFARWAMGLGVTPIFEWCSRRQRIVVDYPEDRLVLIAARSTVSGEYKSMEWLRHYAKFGDWDVEVVKTYPGTTSSMEHLIGETRAAEDIEGWIIRFDDGHMVKVKGDWYVRIHKTKDNLLHEKNVVDLIVNEKMDDAKSFMLDDDRRRVNQFETDFWEGVAQTVRAYDAYFDTVLAHGLDRKRYALEWMPTIKANDRHAPQIVFGRFDGKDTRAMVLDMIRKGTGSQTKIDEARGLWGGFRWSYQFEGDA